MCVCGGAVRERVFKRELEEALKRARLERGPQEFVQEGIRKSFNKTFVGGGDRKGLFKMELEEALKRPLWGRGPQEIFPRLLLLFLCVYSPGFFFC